jgi:hypothetical protein
MITSLAEGQIFVFGANTRGAHGAGAAKQAAKEFGAQYGVREGFTGRCWAFPTLDDNLQKRSRAELERSRDLLYSACEENPELEFLLTKVGCGLAGFSEDFMRGLFTNPPANLVLPEDWKMLNQKENEWQHSQ